MILVRSRGVTEQTTGSRYKAGMRKEKSVILTHNPFTSHHIPPNLLGYIVNPQSRGRWVPFTPVFKLSPQSQTTTQTVTIPSWQALSRSPQVRDSSVWWGHSLAQWQYPQQLGTSTDFLLRKTVPWHGGDCFSTCFIIYNAPQILVLEI